jgi:hypothetical protein
MSRKQKLIVIGGIILIAVILWVLMRQSDSAKAPAVLAGPDTGFSGNVPQLAFPGVEIPGFTIPSRSMGYNPSDFPVIPTAPTNASNSGGNACCDKCDGETANFTYGSLIDRLYRSMGGAAIGAQLGAIARGLNPPGFGYGFA